MQENKFLVPISILIAGALIAWGLSSNGGGTDQPLDDNGDNGPAAGEIRPVSEDDHILGNPNAELVMIEYSDLECPFCKNFHFTTKQLMEDYGKDGKLALVFRQFPLEQLHSKAKVEAIATECAAELGGNAKFWEYMDELFAITPSNNGLDLEQLPVIAEKIGLDVDEFTACQDDPKIADKVDADLQDAIAAGAQGTPYSIIIEKDGTTTPVNGAQPYNIVKSTIEEILAK